MTNNISIDLANITYNIVNTLDIYITDNDYAFANISIDHNDAYYCLGTEDMREDGKIALSGDKSQWLINSIVTSIQNQKLDNAPTKLIIKISISLNDNRKIALNQASIGSDTIIEIIDCLSRECDEFLFLDIFKNFI